MLEINWNHGRNYLKHVRIIRPPFSHLADTDGIAIIDPVPQWVSEACLGLEFDPASLSTDKKIIRILPDNWIGALKLQNPNKNSAAAAGWICEHVHWGGVISTPVENMEILGEGRVLEKGQRCYDIAMRSNGVVEIRGALEPAGMEIISAK